MARVFRAAILMVCILSAGRAFAAGGACPSGANYTSLTNPTGALVTLSSYGVTNCYYVAANGSDANTGTDETHPWQHAPQMPNCSSACATVQNAGIPAGTGIILRGGDTWHFGASTTPASGGVWNFNSGTFPVGSSGSPIYVGVDTTWFTGASWARPILNADNPPCNAGTLSGTCKAESSTNFDLFYVTSCAYQIGSANDFFDFGGLKYYIVDNFEMTGLCQSDVGQPTHHDVYLSYGSPSGPMWFLNLYAHGWSHLQFAGANGGVACTGSAVCFNIFVFNGGGVPPNGENVLKVVVDGSDSDPMSAGFCFGGMYNVAYNVILNTSQCVATPHLFHDNLYADFYENGHSNWFEELGEPVGTNAVYNNVGYNLQTSGPLNGGVLMWPDPPVGTTEFVFNNLLYNVGNMETFNIGQNGSSQ